MISHFISHSLSSVFFFFFEEISVSLKVFFSLVHFICNFMPASNSIQILIMSLDHFIPWGTRTSLESSLLQYAPQLQFTFNLYLKL